MNSESRLSRLVLISPRFLLVFLIIPLVVVVSLMLHLRLPLVGAKLLLFNNACFALLIACRFLRYLFGTGKSLRYYPDFSQPREGVTLPLSSTEARRTLAAAGYSFDADGSYGEKRDLGYIGSLLFYGGLLLLLSVGTWDNLRQFSGTLLDGIGAATKLNRLEAYRSLSMGPLAQKPDSLPRMEILSQFLPDRTYPRGATQVLFVFSDGKVQQTILKPGEPFNAGEYDIYMTQLVFEPEVVIRTIRSDTVFEGMVKLNPLRRNVGGYGFYGTFANANLTGEVYYQPENSRLRVVMKRDGKRVLDTGFTFQVERQATQADLILSCGKMGQWSEIRVVHRRHMGALGAGAAVAIIGLLLRILIRPQRVWLEDAGEGCRIKAVGSETKRLLKV